MLNAIDIETYGTDTLIPYCCCFIYKNKKNHMFGSIICIKQSLDLIFNLCPDKTIFFAHNLTFDGSLLISFLPETYAIEQTNTLILNGNIFSLGLKKNNITIIFRCSFRLFPESLNTIAHKFNLANKKDFDVLSITEHNYKTYQDLAIDYCYRDVEIVCQFLQCIDKRIFPLYPFWSSTVYSLSGLSLILFKKLFNPYKHKLKLSFQNDCGIRPAYHGGRCEVFGNAYSTDFVFHFDFSGMYTNRLFDTFPSSAGVLINNPTIIKNGFYSVKVFSDNLDIPILPYKCEITQKLLFPNGMFSGVYWSEELNLFTQNGGIIKNIYWGIEYDKFDLLFAKFAKHCTKQRLQSQIDKALWKIIPNSLIGRLGLKNSYEKTIIMKECDYDPHNYNVISDIKINNVIISRIKTCNVELSNNSDVTIPAIVTAKARILWWLTATEVQKFGGRLLYCDTDSLFVAYNRDVTNETHGIIKWSDSNQIKKSCFATSKCYAVQSNETNIVHIKGVPINSLSFECFEHLFYNSLSIDINSNEFKKHNFKIWTQKKIKDINIGQYDKRIFSSDKKTTKPLIFEDTLYNV